MGGAIKVNQADHRAPSVPQAAMAEGPANHIYMMPARFALAVNSRQQAKQSVRTVLQAAMIIGTIAQSVPIARPGNTNRKQARGRAPAVPQSTPTLGAA